MGIISAKRGEAPDQMVVILTATFLLALIPFSQVCRLDSGKSYGGSSPGQDAQEGDLSVFPISSCKLEDRHIAGSMC